MIPALVYSLCAVTSLACAVLLMRAYLRRRTKLLLWSAAAFAGFVLNNVLLFVDLIVVPATDLSMVRTLCALAAVVTLLYGLVRESVG